MLMGFTIKLSNPVLTDLLVSVYVWYNNIVDAVVTSAAIPSKMNRPMGIF